ncbi:MAG TPA: hypothetical protein VF399_09095 [bacterium]
MNYLQKRIELFICGLCFLLLIINVCSKKDGRAKIDEPYLPRHIKRESAWILQEKINELSDKARSGKYREFSAADRAVLWLGFRSLVAGGYAQGYVGAATVLDHYLSASGKDLAVDPVYFQKSPVIVKVLDRHYKKITLTPNSARQTVIPINPVDYGWLDTNMRYMMNPFSLIIKDSLAEGKIAGMYWIECRIEFYKNARTYFFLAGDTIVFPDNLGVALESLGMGKPFNLTSAWQETRDLK